MNAGCLSPGLHRGHDAIGYPAEVRPIQIPFSGEVVLVAVSATEIAEVRNVPLDIEWIIHLQFNV